MRAVVVGADVAENFVGVSHLILKRPSTPTQPISTSTISRMQTMPHTEVDLKDLVPK